MITIPPAGAYAENTDKGLTKLFNCRMFAGILMNSTLMRNTKIAVSLVVLCLFSLSCSSTSTYHPLDKSDHFLTYNGEQRTYVVVEGMNRYICLADANPSPNPITIPGALPALPGDRIEIEVLNATGLWESRPPYIYDGAATPRLQLPTGICNIRLVCVVKSVREIQIYPMR